MTDETTQALLPCPFCGGNVVTVGHGFATYAHEPDWLVGCDGCGANIFEHTKQAAITAWNTRLAHSLPSQADEGERFDKIAAVLNSTAFHVALKDPNGPIGHPAKLILATLTPPTSGEEMRLREALPADVVRLVVSAREIAFNDWDGDSEEWAVARKELDDASEAFASRVPWENE